MISEKASFNFKRFALYLALATALLLLIPLIAMQFSGEVNWGPGDFLVAAALLFGAGMAYGLLARRSSHATYRVAAGGAVAGVLLLVWANLAVGLIGSENEAFNGLFYAVPLIGALLAAVGGLGSAGLSRALFGMALVQALIAVTALATGMQHGPYSSTAEILGVNGFFLALWLLSAGLFQRARREKDRREGRGRSTKR